jgi:N-sulfoglucosamine sulfohydrolase
MQIKKYRWLLFFFVLGWVGAFTQGVANIDKGRKPNMLIIVADDCTYSDLALYGGQNVSTPNIDKLASQGLTFNKAYVSMSMCTPSRSELFTGLSPLRNGASWNHAETRNGTKSIVQYLDEQGYRTGIAGKIHVFPETVFPFQKVPGVERNCVSKTADFSTEGMEDFINRSDDQPFCLVSALVVPHIPWTVGDASHFDPDELKLPSYLADTKETRENFAKYLAEIEVLDRQVGEVLRILDESGKADNTLVIFTSEQGAQFPYCKWTNWDMGVHTGFTVRWPGEIAPNTRTDALIQYNDVLPTILDILGADIEARFDGSSFLKVLTGEKETHRKYAYFMHNNIPEGPAYPIRSITDGEYHLIHNLKADALYIEKHLMAEMPVNSYWSSWIFESSNNESIRQLVNGYMKRSELELYHTPSDPFQRNNLKDIPKNKSRRVDLERALSDWRFDQNDPGILLDTWDAFRSGKKGEHKY